MVSKLLKNEQGVTLIEVLISVALLGIITTVFIQILNSSILLRSKSDLQAEASAIATSQIEAIKQAGVPPTALSVTKTELGFDVVTTFTDVTESLTLNKTPINQANGNDYNAAPINMTFGANLVFNGNTTSTIPMTSITENTFTLNISENVSSAVPLQYTLTYNDAGTLKTIDLGNFEKLVNQKRFIKLVRLPELKGGIVLRVNDNTREPLQFGIFEDKLHQISVVPIGADTKLSVSQNFSEQGDPSSLNQKYYEILVTVSKHGQTYARLLSTWTVKGD